MSGARLSPEERAARDTAGILEESKASRKTLEKIESNLKPLR